MTEQQHPITIPPELLSEWIRKELVEQPTLLDAMEQVANKAGQWCADQELEACEEWLSANSYRAVDIGRFRAARRFKPPLSLAEQALVLLAQPKGPIMLSEAQAEVIRQALKSPPTKPQ